MTRHRLLTLLALCSTAFVSTPAAAKETAVPMPSSEEMWRIIQQQQQQIEELTAMVKANQTETAETRLELAQTKTTASKAQAEASSTRQELTSTQAQLEATTLAVEEAGSGSFGSAGWWENTSIGGYGELHANFYDDSRANEIDFHRFVLFFNHDFNDWISLYSELEIEHTSIGDTDDGSSNGEVKLEQAFLRLNWTDQFSTDAGLFLMPLGILNDTHEPNTFYGVERNRVEVNIIPTTWFEGGVRSTYRFDNGLMVEGGVSSGLDMSNDYRIRSSRQDVAQAPAQEPAFFSRIRYTGIAGLELVGSFFYQDDMTQDNSIADYSGLLTSAHAIYTYEAFTLKALYAQWNLSGDINDSDAETQYGFYIEPSYRWNLSERYGDLGVFLRYSDYEYFNGNQRENEVVTLGVNWWPTNNVVFKADLQSYDNGSGDNGNDNDHSVNLGVGYQF